MRVLSQLITHAVAPPTDVECIAFAKVREVVDQLRNAAGNPRERFGVSFAKLEGVKANSYLTPDGVRAMALPIHPRELTVEALQKIERYLCSVDLTPPRSASPDAGYVKALTRAFANEGIELVATTSAGEKLMGVLHIQEMRLALTAKENGKVDRVNKRTKRPEKKRAEAVMIAARRKEPRVTSIVKPRPGRVATDNKFVVYHLPYKIGLSTFVCWLEVYWSYDGSALLGPGHRKRVAMGRKFSIEYADIRITGVHDRHGLTIFSCEMPWDPRGTPKFKGPIRLERPEAAERIARLNDDLGIW